MNGQATSTISVEDGDSIDIELQTEGSCTCCKTQSDCSSQSTGMWVQKSNKDKSTIALDKRTLMAKIKAATDKVRGRRRKG